MEKLIVSLVLITALCAAADQFKDLGSHEIFYDGITQGSNCITFTTHWHSEDLEANYFRAGPLKGQYRAKRVCYSGMGFNSLEVSLDESAKVLFHKLKALQEQQREAQKLAQATQQSEDQK